MTAIPRVVAMLLMAAAPVLASAMSPMESDARYDYYGVLGNLERHESPRMDSVLPLSAPIEGQQAYPTLQAAMEAAAHDALTVSTEYESGGALYNDDSGYHYTKPVSAARTEEIDYRVALPHGAKIVALFHTHPGHTGTAGEFSESDKLLEQRMGLPLFVLAIDTKIVIGLGAPGFGLDVVPVVYPTVVINGITYRVHGERGVYLLLEYHGHLFLAPKPQQSAG